MQLINVGQGQTLADIALVYGGRIESIATIAMALDKGLTDEILVGMLKIPTFSEDKILFFADKPPATNLEIGEEGVDFWEMESEFLIT